MSASDKETAPRRKRGGAGWLFLLLLLLGSIFYLTYAGGVNWREQYAALQEWLFGRPAPEKPVEQTVVPPTFGLVRATPEGEVVASGQAEPGWTVRIETDRGALGETKAGANGDWAFDGGEPLPPGDHSLSLRATDPEGKRSVVGNQRIALSLGAKGAGEPLVALTEEGKPTRILQRQPDVPAAAVPQLFAGKPDDKPAAPAAQPDAPRKPGEDKRAEDKQAERQEQAAAKPDDAARPAEAVKPAGDGAKAQPEAPKAAGKLSFSSIDYESEGNGGKIFINGEAAPGSRVMIYINNAFAGQAIAGPDGIWTFSGPSDLPPGSYQIRADQVESGSGKVMARAEVSFEQDGPDRVAVAEESKPAAAASPAPAREQAAARADAAGGAAPAADKPKAGDNQRREAAKRPRRPRYGKRRGARVVVVRRGDTLWHIARRHYGAGYRYTKIFSSNKTQIRDPDEIYPNQKFVLPR